MSAERANPDADAPRARLIPPTQWDPELLAFVQRASLNDGDPLNFFHVMACYPALLMKWTRFAAHLLGRGRLAPRDRELLILRTVWNCGARYEWVHHSRLAGASDLTPGEIAAIADGPGAVVWDERERALLAAADELHADSVISEDTWSALAGSYDDADLLELVMVVGNYHLVSYFVRSFGVPLEAAVDDAAS